MALACHFLGHEFYMCSCLAMDPAQQLNQRRQEQRRILHTFGVDLDSFSDDDLDKLWNSGYPTAKRLQAATREGLEKAGLAPGTVDDILNSKGVLAVSGNLSTRKAK